MQMFVYELFLRALCILNIGTAQDSDVEPIAVEQFSFLYDALQYEKYEHFYLT